MLLVGRFQALMIILVEFAEMDHLKVWQHIRMLFYQECLEGTMWTNRNKQHLKICNSCLCFLLIRLQQTVVVKIHAAHFYLEEHHCTED